MLTELQKKSFYDSLKEYKRKYLVKRHEDLDESGTRIMINYFLSEVLDYIELDEIKTEYTIKGTYADYVIELQDTNKKKQVVKKRHLVVEVKAISLSLNESFIRQAKGYAADEGIDWVLLTNGRHFILYRVLFEKPLSTKEILNIDLKEMDLRKAADQLEYLTKKCVSRGYLEKYWNMKQAIAPANLARYLYKSEMITTLRRALKRGTDISFTDVEVFDSIHELIASKIDIDKPRKILK